MGREAISIWGIAAHVDGEVQNVSWVELINWSARIKEQSYADLKT